MTAPFCPECGPTCPLHSTTAFLDPLHDELDRLRKWQYDVCDQFGYATTPADTAEVLAWIPEFRKKANADAWCRAAAEVECKQAEARAEQAEARVDQLTDQLALANDTLRHRGNAVNATGHTNDQLRATIAKVRAALHMGGQSPDIRVRAAMLALDDQETK